MMESFQHFSTIVRSLVPGGGHYCPEASELSEMVSEFYRCNITRGCHLLTVPSHMVMYDDVVYELLLFLLPTPLLRGTLYTGHISSKGFFLEVCLDKSCTDSHESRIYGGGGGYACHSGACGGRRAGLGSWFSPLPCGHQRSNSGLCQPC